MKLLVTGGAGYIGAVFCKAAARDGHEVVVFDNLSGGYREAAAFGAFIEGDLLDRVAIRSALATRRFDAVVHFASLIAVGESVAAPLRYYQNNVVGSFNLLQAMQETGVRKLVFSSTAAVYGNPDPGLDRITESHRCAPINPYGQGKRMVELALQDAAAAGLVDSVSLRYFNAAGADGEGQLGEAHQPETHLIPLAIQAALGGPALRVFGADYDTPDGTCIRDYIHVEDLAGAHLAALRHLDHHRGAFAFNLGSGRGWSVREVIGAVETVSGRTVPCEAAPRRPGDPPVLVADPGLAAQVLHWRARHSDLGSMVQSAWRWALSPAYGVKS